jgi:glycosyltransferase involved in cell wall biosynthesis
MSTIEIDSSIHRAFLKRTDRVYQSLLRRARSEFEHGAYEPALRWIQMTARYAANAHTGRYVDGALENMLLDLGERQPVLPVQRTASDRLRVLHVATRALPTGGHTRLLARWITHDDESTHHLIVTDQTDAEIPRFVRDAVSGAGGELLAIGGEQSRLARAAAVRAAAQRLAGVCVLHAHQFDPVPVIALAAAALPPVITVNHSDHQFWLGASVTDVIVHLRTFAELLTERRLARAAVRIPIPLRPSEARVSRDEARRQLGLGGDDVMLLTIGTAPKLKPNEWQDYWVTVREILDRNPAAHLFLVGVDEKAARRRLGANGMTRVHAVGFQPDPSIYLAAADIYLEGYPYGSLTAVLDAAAQGVCPVLQYAPTVQADVSDSPGLTRASRPTRDRAEYVDYVTQLIADRDLRRRLGDIARGDTRAAHMGQGWKDLVHRVYADAIAAGHQPRRLPEDVPSLAENPDLLRAHWDGRRYAPYPLAAVAAPEAGSLKNFASLLALSLRHGDTRARLRHALAWAGMLYRHFRQAPE